MFFFHLSFLLLLSLSSRRHSHSFLTRPHNFEDVAMTVLTDCIRMSSAVAHGAVPTLSPLFPAPPAAAAASKISTRTAVSGMDYSMHSSRLSTSHPTSDDAVSVTNSSAGHSIAQRAAAIRERDIKTKKAHFEATSHNHYDASRSSSRKVRRREECSPLLAHGLPVFDIGLHKVRGTVICDIS